MKCKHCGEPIKMDNAGWAHVATKLAFCSLKGYTRAEPAEESE